MEPTGVIRFVCDGAIDFSETVEIELSETFQRGFTKIHPLQFLRETHLPHCMWIFNINFLAMFQRTPHISDMNENLPEDSRWTEIYYKCYRKFHHSHWGFNKASEITPMTLKDAMDHVKERDLSITLSDKVLNKRWKLNETKENTMA